MTGGERTGRRSSLALPGRAYIPQQNERHAEDAFDAIRARADPVTSSRTALHNIAWLHGLDLIETGFYWEAHEVLEAVWLNAAPGTPERVVVQALIQLANAALKQVMGWQKAALRLCDIADDLVSIECVAAQSEVMNLPTDCIRTAIAEMRRAIHDGSLADIALA